MGFASLNPSYELQHRLRSTEHETVVRGADRRSVIRHSLENHAPLVRHAATCYSYSVFPGFDEKGARGGKTS